MSLLLTGRRRVSVKQGYIVRERLRLRVPFAIVPVGTNSMVAHGVAPERRKPWEVGLNHFSHGVTVLIVGHNINDETVTP